MFCIILLLVMLTGCSEGTDKRVWVERWFSENPMNEKRAGLATVSIGDRIYAIGGGEYSSKGLEIFSSVEYADVLDNGRLGEWKDASPMKMPRIYVSAVVYGDHVYVMGGESLDTIYQGTLDQEPPALLDSIERAKILPDGTLGEWILEKESMHFSRRGGQLFVHDGWLYAVGGYNGAFLNDVEKAKINADGSIGKWIQEKNSVNKVRYISGYVNKGNRFFLLGGHLSNVKRAMDSVETTEVMTDSSMTKWKETTPMSTRRFLNAAVLMGDTIYTVAGQNTINLSSVERAEILDDGSLSDWTPETPLNIPRRAASSVAVGDTIYTVGGMFGPIGLAVSIDIVESASVNPGKGLGNFVEAESPERTSYRAWKEAVSVPLDAQSHLKHALEYLLRKDFEVVLFDIAEAIKLSPGNHEAYNLKGDVYYRMGNIKEAKKALEKSIDIKEDNFDALIGLGNISFERGDFKNAIAHYKRGVTINADSIAVHDNLGNAYLSAGDYAAAAKEFQWVVDKDPDSEHAKLLLEMSMKSHKSGQNKAKD